METTRQNKIARLIQKELGDIFLLQTKAMHGVLVSVSTVRISPDLSVARAYLSIFPSERAEEIINNINANAKSIRYELGTRVRFQLRIIPELKFFIEPSRHAGWHLPRSRWCVRCPCSTDSKRWWPASLPTSTRN